MKSLAKTLFCIFLIKIMLLQSLSYSSDTVYQETSEYSSVKSSSDLYYGDDDISEYIDYFLGQSEQITRLAGHSYLLSSQKDKLSPIMDAADKKSYVVAITPAIDTAGKANTRTLTTGTTVSSTEIDYHFDKSLHPKEDKEEILEELISFTSSEVTYTNLLQRIEDLKTGGRKLEYIEDIIAGKEEKLSVISFLFQEELKKIKENKKDVFDEIMCAFRREEDSYAKIFFPYNITQVHWLTGEIRLYKNGHKYNIEIYAHDPYGEGKMADNNFNTLEVAIRKRITEYHPAFQNNIAIKNLKSLYGRRQAQEDTISCGVIAAEDLVKLITGSLKPEITYPLGAKVLRASHLETVKKASQTARYIRRNQPKIEFIHTYEGELRDLSSLFLKLKTQVNEEKPNGTHVNVFELNQSLEDLQNEDLSIRLSAASNPANNSLLELLTDEQLRLLEKLDDDFLWERNDLYRLWNIKTLLENSSTLKPKDLLINLSLQIDAISVHKRALRDRFREKLPWTLLAYMHHGLQDSMVPSEILESITHQIYPEICSLLPILESILSLERKKIKAITARYKLPHKVEKKSRKSKKETYKTPLEEGVSHSERKTYSSYGNLNTSASKKIDKIQGYSLFTHEKRFDLAMQVAEEAAISSPEVREFARKGREKIEERELSIDKEKKTLIPGKFPAFNMLMGALYELENANIAANFINHIGSNPSLEIIYQAITILAEALNNIFIHSNILKLTAEQDILQYRATLKFLRNVFEHPEDYEKEKLVHIEQTNEGKKLFFEILEELYEIVKKLQNRIVGLQKFLAGDLKVAISTTQKPILFEQENPQLPKKNRWKDLLKQPHWTQTNIPALQILRRYLYHPSYQFISLEEEKDPKALESKAFKVCETENLEKKKKGRTITLEGILEDIDQLEKFFANLGNQEQVLHILQDDFSQCLHLQNILNRIFQNLNSKIEDESFSESLGLSRQAFIYCFNDFRERRNFNTHDLWRTDFVGTLNTAYRIIYDIKYILSPLVPTFIPENLYTLDNTSLEAAKKILQHLTDMDMCFVPLKKRKIYETYSDIEMEDIDSGSQDYKFEEPSEEEFWEYDYSNQKFLDFEIEELGKQARACINIQDEKKWTSLHHAVNNDYFAIARFLLELGANPYVRDYKGRTPLHFAAENDNLKMMELLLEFGSLPDPKDCFGLTPYDWAKRNEWHETASFLKSRMGIFRETKADALHTAAELLDINTARELLHSGIYPNLFSVRGELPLVLVLQQESGKTKKQFSVAHLLLKKGANPNKQQANCYPIHAVAEYVEVPRMLNLLLAYGAEVNVQDGCGQTPLHITCIMGNINQTQILIKAGANIHTRDNISERTPLLAAANMNQERYEIIKLLLEADANPNDEGEYGSVLHDVVSESCCIRSTLILLSYGADVNKRGKKMAYLNKTPLEVANRDEIIEILMRDSKKNSLRRRASI